MTIQTNHVTNVLNGTGITKLQSNGVTTNALAWVNFNGTGTVAIRSSYNVSSITDNGTGDYTVNFTTALSDANYSVTGWSQAALANQPYLSTIVSTTTSAVRSTYLTYTAGSYADPSIVCISVHGN